MKKTCVCKKVEVSYTERADDGERLKRITEILAEGVYGYLKTSGLLREDIERTERIKRLVEKAKEVGNQAEEEIEGEDS
jgi:protein involved in temperature-dependent protein secretion